MSAHRPRSRAKKAIRNRRVSQYTLASYEAWWELRSENPAFPVVAWGGARVMRAWLPADPLLPRRSASPRTHVTYQTRPVTSSKTTRKWISGFAFGMPPSETGHLWNGLNPTALFSPRSAGPN